MDQDVVEVMAYCKMAKVRVSVRGTDERVVIEFTDKRTGRIVGGREMRERLDRAFKDEHAQ